MAKTIVVINSYHVGYPWSDRCLQGFNDYIDSEYNIISYQMDTKRKPEKQYSILVDNLWDKIVLDHPDLIVTMDDNALKYFGERVVSEIDVPLVFMGVNQNPRIYFPDNQIPGLVSGVMERPFIERNLAVLSEILPLKKQKLLMLMDDSVTTKSLIESVFANRRSIFVKGIRLDIDTIGGYTEWKEKVLASFSDYDALIIGSFGVISDDSGRTVPVKVVSEWTNLNSKLPLFSFWLNEVGKGKAIGGLVLTGYEAGTGAANIANEILSTGSVPPIRLPKRGELIFSKSELLRWDIQLPVNIKKRSKFVD